VVKFIVLVLLFYFLFRFFVKMFTFRVEKVYFYKPYYESETKEKDISSQVKIISEKSLENSQKPQ